MFPIAPTIGTLFLVLFALFTVGAVRAIASRRKSHARAALLYFLSTIVLVLSLVEFGSLAIFVSETNTPWEALVGSNFRLNLQWMNLLLLTVLWVLLGWRFLPNGKPKPHISER